MAGGRGSSAAAAERRQKAVRLRAHGASYRAIAAALGVSLGQAHKDVAHALADLNATTRERAAEYQALELERLEAPVARLAALIKNRETPPEDLCRAVEAWRKLSESRRKLLGLDAPEKHLHEDTVRLVLTEEIVDGPDPEAGHGSPDCP